MLTRTSKPCGPGGPCYCPRLFSGVVAVAGVAMVILGVITLIGLQGRSFLTMRQWVLRAATAMGTAPAMLPVLITSVGAAVCVAGIFWRVP